MDHAHSNQQHRIVRLVFLNSTDSVLVSVLLDTGQTDQPKSVKLVLKIAMNAPLPPLVLPAPHHTFSDLELAQLHPTTYSKRVILDFTLTLPKTFAINADPHVQLVPVPPYA